jgi:hypothetical protein
LFQDFSIDIKPLQSRSSLGKNFFLREMPRNSTLACEGVRAEDLSDLTRWETLS